MSRRFADWYARKGGAERRSEAGGVVVEGRVGEGSTGVGVCGRVLQRLTCNPNNDDRPRGIHLPDWPRGDLGQVRVHMCVHHPDVTMLPAASRAIPRLVS